MKQSRRCGIDLVVRGIAAAAALCAAAGCDRGGSQSRYSVVIGDVAGVPDEFGEMTVKVVRRGGQDISGETLHCIVTTDAETYIDDRLAPPGDVQVGDRVQLIGLRDPNPAIDRYNVFFVEVQRPPATAPPVGSPAPARLEQPGKE